MENISLCVLAYKNKNRRAYQICAEFLRFSGIYVYEKCAELKTYFSKEKTLDRTGSDQRISDRTSFSERDLYSENKDLYSEDKDFTGEGIVRYEIKDAYVPANLPGNPVRGKVFAVLADLMREIAVTDVSGEYLSVYSDLMDVFIENDLFFSNINLQYFKYNNAYNAAAAKVFQKAAGTLHEKLTEKTPKNRYLWYAKLYCLQKANLAAHLCSLPYAAFVDVLGDECLELVNAYPDFSNAWALMGLISEVSDVRSGEVMSAYRMALQKTGDVPWVSSIYYWIGKFSEHPNILNKHARAAYEKAYGIMKKYRNIYKMGMVYEAADQYDDAVRYFQECLDYLLLKEGYLDPLETEYFFKVYIRIAFINIKKLKEYHRGIRYGKKALEFKKEIEAGADRLNGCTQYYYDVYGPRQAKDYIELSLRKMSTQRICEYMATAYENLGMPDEAKKYYTKF